MSCVLPECPQGSRIGPPLNPPTTFDGFREGSGGTAVYTLFEDPGLVSFSEDFFHYEQQVQQFLTPKSLLNAMLKEQPAVLVVDRIGTLEFLSDWDVIGRDVEVIVIGDRAPVYTVCSNAVVWMPHPHRPSQG